MITHFIKRLLRICGRTRLRGYTILGQKHKPMLRLLEELRTRGVRIEELDALEIFGRDGLDHTTTYGGEVKSLEIWEIDGGRRAELERNFSGAAIKIVDSYEEIARTPKRFDLVVVDNAMGLYGAHCDHFDFFPDGIFRIARDECVLALIVIPRIDDATLRHFPNLRNPEYLSRRAAFYGVEDPMDIPREDMVATYRGFVERSGRRLDWSFLINRSGAGVDYLVLKISR
jgi:hypothetical protein